MMPGFANLNYYEILDVSMGDDAKEVQEAYYLVREAFSKNSLSSYSLYTQEEREEIGRLIEEAYHILFDDQSRQEYDRNLSENRIRVEKSKKILQAGLPFDESAEGLRARAAAEAGFDATEPADLPAAEEATGPDDSQASLPFVDENTPAPAMAADLPPPSETSAPGPADEVTGEGSEPLLLTEKVSAPPQPPDANEAQQAPAAEVPDTAPSSPAPAEAAADEEKIDQATMAPPAPAADEATAPPASVINPVAAGPANGQQPDLEASPGPGRAVLDHLRDGITGPSLKRVREQRGLSLDQAFEVTRIRKPILQSIEDEEFDKLPAAVFLRGMVANYVRFLGLPDPEATAKIYMERMAAGLGG